MGQRGGARDNASSIPFSVVSACCAASTSRKNHSIPNISINPGATIEEYPKGQQRSPHSKGA